MCYLEELKDTADMEGEQFRYGEKTAYTEMAEMLQYWERAGKHGLDFDIEGRYPL